MNSYKLQKYSCSPTGVTNRWIKQKNLSTQRRLDLQTVSVCCARSLFFKGSIAILQLLNCDHCMNLKVCLKTGHERPDDNSFSSCALWSPSYPLVDPTVFMKLFKLKHWKHVWGKVRPRLNCPLTQLTQGPDAATLWLWDARGSSWQTASLCDRARPLLLSSLTGLVVYVKLTWLAHLNISLWSHITTTTEYATGNWMMLMQLTKVAHW